MNIFIIILTILAGFGLFVGVLFLISMIMPSKIKEKVKTIYSRVAKTKIVGQAPTSVPFS